MTTRLERLVDPESGDLFFNIVHECDRAGITTTMPMCRKPVNPYDFSVQFTCTSCNGRWLVKLDYTRRRAIEDPVFLDDPVPLMPVPPPSHIDVVLVYTLHDRRMRDRQIDTVDAS